MQKTSWVKLYPPSGDLSLGQLAAATGENNHADRHAFLSI